MNIRTRVFVGMSLLCVVLCAAAAFAQVVEETVVEIDEADPEALKAGEMAIYGEVQSVDAAAGTMDVQYYDYDSDSEKTLTVAVTDATTMENAASLAGITKGDWADVVYVTKDGKDTATLVTVEKEELEEDISAVEIGETAPAE